MSFKERFIAWWNGEVLPEAHRGEAALDSAALAGAAAGAAAAPKPAVEQWEAGRFELMERIWGDGLCYPGGEDHLMKLVTPFGLNPAFSVADFGAGFGGGGQIVADAFGAWVNGYEFDCEYAAYGDERAERLGLTRKAPVTFTDVETFSMRENAFHCAYSMLTFFKIENKSHVLRMIEKGLHPGGQFAFTDYLVTEEGRGDPMITQWMEAEDPTPHPWTLKHYQAELTNLNLDVRIAEDTSDRHQSDILAGWAHFAESLKPGGVARGTTLLMVMEAEKWVRRVAALRSGHLRYYRFYVTKPTN